MRVWTISFVALTVVLSGFAQQAAAWQLPRCPLLPDPNPRISGKIDLPVKVRKNGSFIRSGYHKIDRRFAGDPVRDIGNGRIEQVLFGGSFDAYGEMLLFSNCQAGEAVVFWQLETPPRDECGSFVTKPIDALKSPKGPISLSSSATVSELVAASKTSGISSETDFDIFLGLIRFKDRFDPMYGCKLYYPDSPGAEE